MSVHTTITASTERYSLRAAGLIGAAGALSNVATAAFAAPDRLGEPGFSAWDLVSVLSFAMLLIGLLGLARSGAAGAGWLARIGLTTAFVGLGLFTVIEVMARSDPDAGEHLHPISVPLTAIGMVLTGIAVIRAGRWHGWRRVTPCCAGCSRSSSSCPHSSSSATRTHFATSSPAPGPAGWPSTRPCGPASTAAAWILLSRWSEVGTT